ncbi:MAG TPA: hypothetical protein VJT09_09255 [Pyrinomonadaceae bacterium]|nr:hypothetical protein [Pyrinomonadaceae bacterium]
MSITDDRNGKRDDAERSRRAIFMVAGLVAILLIVGLIVFLKTRPEPQPIAATTADQKLEGGLRAGSPEFEKYRDLVKTDEPIADYANSVAGDVQMNLATTIRNFTGRTLSGVEMRGAVVDFEGKTIKERTKIVIPAGSVTELENNGTAKVPIAIPGFRGDDKAKIEGGQAVIKMEVTAIKFK